MYDVRSSDRNVGNDDDEQDVDDDDDDDELGW